MFIVFNTWYLRTALTGLKPPRRASRISPIYFSGFSWYVTTTAKHSAHQHVDHNPVCTFLTSLFTCPSSLGNSEVCPRTYDMIAIGQRGNSARESNIVSISDVVRGSFKLPTWKLGYFGSGYPSMPMPSLSVFDRYYRRSRQMLGGRLSVLLPVSQSSSFVLLKA